MKHTQKLLQYGDLDNMWPAIREKRSPKKKRVIVRRLIVQGNHAERLKGPNSDSNRVTQALLKHAAEPNLFITNAACFFTVFFSVSCLFRPPRVLGLFHIILDSGPSSSRRRYTILAGLSPEKLEANRSSTFLQIVSQCKYRKRQNQ